MSEKTVVVALGHRALGTTLPEQKTATKLAAKVIACLLYTSSAANHDLYLLQG